MNFDADCYDFDQAGGEFDSDQFFKEADRNSRQNNHHFNNFFEVYPLGKNQIAPKVKETRIENTEIQAHPMQEESIVENNQIALPCHIAKKAVPQRARRKRKIKPSPYHNFQKHLSIALKHLFLSFSFDQVNPLSKVTSLAREIWAIFVKSQFATKKMLHFVFNQHNELPIQQKDLKELGLQEIYRVSSHEELCQAKNYLTQMALNQLTDNNIDDYLNTRRIKNVPKFKRYIQLFRQQLQDGFIKKRFTNRTRKSHMKADADRELN